MVKIRGAGKNTAAVYYLYLMLCIT